MTHYLAVDYCNNYRERRSFRLLASEKPRFVPECVMCRKTSAEVHGMDVKGSDGHKTRSLTESRGTARSGRMIVRSTRDSVFSVRFRVCARFPERSDADQISREVAVT